MDDFQVGDAVIYTPDYVSTAPSDRDCEEGTVVEVTENYVIVQRAVAHEQPMPCRRDQLTLAQPARAPEQRKAKPDA